MDHIGACIRVFFVDALHKSTFTYSLTYQRCRRLDDVIAVSNSRQQKQNHSGVPLLASSTSSRVPRSVSVLTTSSQEEESTSATLGHTSTATCPWRLMCHGPCPVVSHLCVTYAVSVAPSPSPFCRRLSQRYFCLVSTTTASHWAASQSVWWIVCSQCSTRQQHLCTTVVKRPHDPHLPASARPALTTRS